LGDKRKYDKIVEYSGVWWEEFEKLYEISKLCWAV